MARAVVKVHDVVHEAAIGRAREHLTVEYAGRVWLNVDGPCWKSGVWRLCMRPGVGFVLLGPDCPPGGDPMGSDDFGAAAERASEQIAAYEAAHPSGGAA